MKQNTISSQMSGLLKKAKKAKNRKGVNNNEKLIGTLKMFETMEHFQDEA